ncbi:DUF2924 domain-containing protein [bacterium]|nr:DUF2924 domain-containing protein [bacterium]
MTKKTQAGTDTAALEKLTIRQLQARAKKLTGKATRSKNRTTLIERCAAALAEPPAEENAPRRRASKRRIQLDVGTVLTRKFRGKEIAVTVTDEGFEYDGHIYSSLSALAVEICGYPISGPAFFKLGSRKQG